MWVYDATQRFLVRDISSNTLLANHLYVYVCVSMNVGQICVIQLESSTTGVPDRSVNIDRATKVRGGPRHQCVSLHCLCLSMFVTHRWHISRTLLIRTKHWRLYEWMNGIHIIWLRRPSTRRGSPLRLLRCVRVLWSAFCVRVLRHAVCLLNFSNNNIIHFILGFGLCAICYCRWVEVIMQMVANILC